MCSIVPVVVVADLVGLVEELAMASEPAHSPAEELRGEQKPQSGLKCAVGVAECPLAVPSALRPFWTS